jgi:DNA-binding transcriptional regulator/RsmH inhibitor MraZ
MFGEKNIYGAYQMIKDEKNRVSLPTQTGAEKGDELIVFTMDGDIYLMNKIIADKVISDINERILYAPNNETRLQLKKQLDELTENFVKTIKVGSAGRVSLSKIVESKNITGIGQGKMFKIIDSKKSKYVGESKKMD